MIFIVSAFLVRKGFNGITLWPFIIARQERLKEDVTFVTHEKIHLRQQIEMLVIPFYLWYMLEFFFRIFQYKNRRTAYKNISFEREAFAHEKDLDYLKTRSLWTFLKYI